MKSNIPLKKIHNSDNPISEQPQMKCHHCSKTFPKLVYLDIYVNETKKATPATNKKFSNSQVIKIDY